MLDLITHVTVLLCTAYCPPAPTLAGRVSPVTGKHGATETRFWLFSLRPGSPGTATDRNLPSVRSGRGAAEAPHVCANTTRGAVPLRHQHPEECGAAATITQLTH